MCVLRTAVAPSLSLDQRHGTCSKTICVSRTWKLTVFVVHWRRVFLISTRHIERIRGAFCDDALYKLTFTLPADASLCFESSTVYLLHQVDTRGKCGHFDLLVGKNTWTSAMVISVIELGDKSTLTAPSDAEYFGLVRLLSWEFSTAGVSSVNLEVLDECVSKSQPKTTEVVLLSAEQGTDTQTDVKSKPQSVGDVKQSGRQGSIVVKNLALNKRTRGPDLP